MTDPRLTAFQKDADKTLQFLHSEFSKLQTGRANAALIEHIEADVYGQRMNLKSVASISVQDARTIVVQPWDKGTMQSVEKALQQASLGINPVNDGVVLRIILPPMTEERRRDLTKIVNTLAEEARITIRKSRQSAHDAIKQDADEDVKHTLLEQLQKLVDAANESIDASRKAKDEELMKI